MVGWGAATEEAGKKGEGGRGEDTQRGEALQARQGRGMIREGCRGGWKELRHISPHTSLVSWFRAIPVGVSCCMAQAGWQRV